MAGVSKVKGNAHRLIQIPGYHIHPQFDLIHTRHLIEEKKSRKPNFHLNLAPMVDMFSVLVIYLLMSFSTDGEIFFISKDVTIPMASSGRPMQSYPLISIVDGNLIFDAVSGGSTTERNDQRVPRLRAALKQIKNLEIQMAGEKGFKGQVNLQADEKTPAEEVKKVMRVLIEEGWTGINFVVSPEKKG